jgi:hypothetical protein
MIPRQLIIHMLAAAAFHQSRLVNPGRIRPAEGVGLTCSTWERGDVDQNGAIAVVLQAQTCS